MIYLVIKAIHMTSVLIFIGGLLMLSAFITSSNLPVQRSILRWDKYITVPALAVLWITGLTIAIKGHWFGDMWLTLKLVFVIALSALHGVLSGTLRRVHLMPSENVSSKLELAPIVVLVTAAVIVFLVIVKP